MYESPIEIIQTQLRTAVEDNIYKAIQSYDVVVDKDELIKALSYDRDQYAKGYADAQAAVAREIFEELERTIMSPDWQSQNYKEWYFAVLKKKYVGG